MKTGRIAVAWSGGRDSTALLHATLVAAATMGVEVIALHVHHGLSPLADDWARFCESQVSRWQRRYSVRLRVARLAGHPGPGESIEAWARRGRYGALRTLALEEGAQAVLLAHHRRDQAETFLIQALRGAGVAGLSGMPKEIERDGVRWVRPWLAREPRAIIAYVRRHRLRHVEDDSNTDPRFARNRLRMQVWPALERAFPGTEATLSDAAEWARQASACLADLAAIDLGILVDARGLAIAPWLHLPESRRANALRHWLRDCLGRPASASLVERLLVELPLTRHACWEEQGGSLRLYRGHLGWRAGTGGATRIEPRAGSLSILRAGRHPLPDWGGVLRVVRVREGGVPLSWLAHVELRERRGGEQFQAGVGRPPRSLKKQFQAQAVPAWERDGPLVYSGGQLVFVPGLGLDARVIGLPGQPLVSLSWERKSGG